MIELERHTVYLGKIVIASQPSLISTILGSCVSVCLWNKVNKIGAINHFLLPGEAPANADPRNYGINSTKMLVESVLKLNNNIFHLEAKLFGGCNSIYKAENIYKVGERNVASAIKVLAEFGIPVVAHHIGGIYGRKIVFNSATGKVRMRLLEGPFKESNNEDNKGFGY